MHKKMPWTKYQAPGEAQMKDFPDHLWVVFIFSGIAVELLSFLVASKLKTTKQIPYRSHNLVRVACFSLNHPVWIKVEHLHLSCHKRFFPRKATEDLWQFSILNSFLRWLINFTYICQVLSAQRWQFSKERWNKNSLLSRIWSKTRCGNISFENLW